MKHMSIWQRLNTALAVLVVLLMAGCGLALWIKEVVTNADERGEQLANKTDKIYLDEALMSDALRGVLLDPKSEVERKSRQHAEADLAANLKFIKENFSK